MKALEKFEQYKHQTLFPKLTSKHQTFVQTLALKYHFTFQELREICEKVCDLQQWGEPFFPRWQQNKNENKELFFKQLRIRFDQLKNNPKHYPKKREPKPKQRQNKFHVTKSDKKIFGLCPVYSEETVCCNLQTIDAVENCGFGCNYCSIQTFYNEPITFDVHFLEKLEGIQLDPNRFYHIGTGQSSDSLLWGNRYELLDTLCDFARKHPNILLEFKTKAANISYFLEREVPSNIVLAWSLNTETIIQNEEHFTANLEKRLKAARKIADQNIRVAFHFHPMIYYDVWKKEYTSLVHQIQETFSPKEVLFISFGSVTLIKPVIQAIRKSNLQTKILQMPFVKDPKGKWTYPDSIKVEMFKEMYKTFTPWHKETFFYLCMEKKEIWEKALGYVYPDNKVFEADFASHIKKMEN